MTPDAGDEDDAGMTYRALPATAMPEQLDGKGGTTSSEQRARLGHFSVFVALLVYALCVSLGKVNVNNNTVFFIERDPAISFPYKSSQVPVSMLEGIAIGVPLAFIAICTLFFLKYKQAKSLYVLGNTSYYLIFSLAQCLLGTDAVTNTIKVLVLRPRPNFLAYCNYKGYYDAMQSGNYSAYNHATTAGVVGSTANCLSQSHFPDAVLSFPSGHSSTSWAGMTFISLLLKYAIEQHEPFRLLSWHGAVFIAPLYLSAWVSITRIQDYYHHEDDCMMGAFIGATTSFYVFKAVTHLLDTYCCQKRGGEGKRSDAAGTDKLPA